MQMLYDLVLLFDSPKDVKYIEVRFKGGEGWTNILLCKKHLHIKLFYRLF